jgi:hypothetical protein
MNFITAILLTTILFEPPDYPINPAPGITQRAIPPGYEEVFGRTEFCFPAPMVLSEAFTIVGTTVLDGEPALVIRDRRYAYAILLPHPQAAGLLCIQRIVHEMV